VLQRCFAGVETRDDVLWLNPCWPDSLGKLQLPIVYHGHAITLTVLGHTVLVHSGPGSVPPVRVGWSGQVHELSAEQTLVFPLQQMAAMAQEG
jgi:trehalose/maltose hydrolase-like predicted phosphorylase